MRIFLGFFGITRSLRHTISSINQHIFRPLQQAGIEAPRYGHFHLPDQISNRRSGEFGVSADPTESALLDLQKCQLDPQNHEYIAEALAIGRRYPDHYGDNYVSASNLCFQLRSLDRLWGMMEPDITGDDWVAFLRPDLLYVDRIDLSKLVARLSLDKADLAVPGWQSWGGLNDRFAIANARAAHVYATRIQKVEAATAKIGVMHAETLLGFAAASACLRVGRLPMRALRVRANGQIAQNDLMCFGLGRNFQPIAGRSNAHNVACGV
jgi:hypothetical protein